MISVVLYGRNDSYGYNLHKRAVLSLNCIAELLDEPDDEILFVDYNTPDDLPTFVEAIADMLTPRAKELLRAIRVRPASHAKFAHVTHLKALESPARNAAIRRANVRNRWILSTNTDMVFITGAKSLSSIAAELPDGFYHTARFELPEVLWETLDRSDPRDCMQRIDRWGRRLQLQEVMYGSEDTLFDGPGDFQLFLRKDAFSIDGFDERMLLGWHIDSNIAKRLSLLRREPVKSALALVRAFHCDHNRESTPMHAHGAVQNDWRRWVTKMSVADIQEQRDSWGFHGETLEELRVADQDAIPRVLESVVPPMQTAFYVAGLQPAQDLRYDPEHVIPYLANVIAALPRNWNVFYAGCRSKTFDMFQRLWTGLGFTAKILVDEHVAEFFTCALTDAVEVVDEARALEEAGFFIFEVGLSDDDASAVPAGARESPEAGARPMSREEYARTMRVHRAFVRAVAAENARDGTRRRFFLINMHGNPLDPSVSSRIAGSWTPKSTRIKHGFAVPDPFEPHPKDAGDWLYAKITGKWRPALPLVRGLIEDIAGTDHPRAWIDEWIVGASELIDILSSEEAATALGVDARRLATVIAALEQRRPSRAVREAGIIEVPNHPAIHRRLSRMVAVEDFDDPEWRRCAIRVVGPGPLVSAANRTKQAWNAAHVVYVLERLGLESGASLVLQTPADETADFQPVWAAVYDWVERAENFDGSFPFPDKPTYESIVIAPRFLLMGGLHQVPAVFQRVDTALKTGGACIAFFDLTFQPQADRLLPADLGNKLFSEALRSHTAWQPSGTLAVELTAQTIDTIAVAGAVMDRQQRKPFFGGCFVYQKSAATPPEAWDRLRNSVLSADGTAVTTPTR